MDGNNVIGAVADGWWRDRPGAVRRLLARLVCVAVAEGVSIDLVLDVAQPDLPEGDHDGVTVRYATRRGRDGADDRIRALLAEVAGAGGDMGTVEVITSDRALRRDVEVTGARVVGAGTFLRRLEGAGC